MVVTIVEDADAASDAVADLLCDAIAARPSLVLGLPAGRTPLPLFAELGRRCVTGRVDFSQVTTFNVDEFDGVASISPGSFRRFMEEQFFAHVNVERTRVNFLDGVAPDVIAECSRYEAAIAAAGGIDVQILGIGANGHIGFNEPADQLIAMTHRSELSPRTRQANAASFDGRIEAVPHWALTMGIGTILSTREVILIATGRAKAEAIARMIEGGLTTRVPASFLQLHPRVRVVVDRSAAARLT